MTEPPAWQCGNCDTLVDPADTRKCPTCGYIFFYPVADDVAESEGEGRLVVEEFDIDGELAKLDERREE
ncbi:MAG: hypothetical protein ABEJ27_01850 [Halodesulfurarchaeum sp.]